MHQGQGRGGVQDVLGDGDFVCKGMICCSLWLWGWSAGSEVFCSFIRQGVMFARVFEYAVDIGGMLEFVG